MMKEICDVCNSVIENEDEIKVTERYYKTYSDFVGNCAREDYSSSKHHTICSLKCYEKVINNLDSTTFNISISLNIKDFKRLCGQLKEER